MQARRSGSFSSTTRLAISSRVGAAVEYSSIARLLFDDRLITEEIDPRDVDERSLWAEEAPLVRGAVQKRRREFAAGRLCARKALKQLGVPETSILAREDRTPQWPVGVVGSITHTGNWCAVVVGMQEHIRGVGVDVEIATPLKDKLFDRVCTPSELQWLASLPEAERGKMGKLIFSAKECAYKSQYPLTQTYLGFHAMSVKVDPRGTFVAEFQKNVASFEQGDQISGRYVFERDLVMTGCAIPVTS